MGIQRTSIVIGAGICGLLIARKLSCSGIKVTVLDKGRGVGGRMATRRFAGGRVDHGAQYFTSRGHHMKELVRSLENSRMLRVWSRGFAGADGVFNDDGIDRYMAIDGMSAIPKLLAEGLDVAVGTRVESISSCGDHWKVVSDDGKIWLSESMVLTAPAEQALKLLEAGNTQIDTHDRQSIESIKYHPCYALMLRLDGPSSIPSPGGMWGNGNPIIWLGDNSLKGLPLGSDSGALVTVHASPSFTQENWDANPDSVAGALIEAAHPWLGSRVASFEVHRWKYSLALQALDPSYLILRGHPLGILAGDGFGGGKIEGAVNSAHVAAAAFLDRLPE